MKYEKLYEHLKCRDKNSRCYEFFCIIYTVKYWLIKYKLQLDIHIAECNYGYLKVCGEEKYN